MSLSPPGIDKAMEIAHWSNGMQRKTVKPEYWDRACIVAHGGRLSVYREGAWTEPVGNILPWSPPVGEIVARVYHDGRVDA